MKKSLGLYALVVVTAIFVSGYFKPNVFEINDLHQIARNAVGIHPIEQAFNNVTLELMKRYPGKIFNDTDWIFINAVTPGGWMGAFKLLHASLHEYVLLFGSAVPTTGHSGRYWGAVYDFLIAGEFHQWDEGSLHVRKHFPGARIEHPDWAITSMHLEAGSWMLEYSRGVIPSYLPFALADSFTSTLDFITVSKYFWTYGKLVFRSLSESIL